jgi:hypothetical protein
MDIRRLYVGHFGIADNPGKVIQRALAGIQSKLDIGAWCVKDSRVFIPWCNQALPRQAITVATVSLGLML